MKLITQELLNELIVKTKINITRTEELKTQSEETLNFKESQDKWSVLECIEHLNIYGIFYNPEIKKCVQNTKSFSSKYFKTGVIGNYFVNLMLPKKKLNKMKTLKVNNPIGSNLDKKTLDIFIDQQNDFLNLLEKSKTVNLTKIKTAISISKIIKLRLGDTLRFVTAHNERHLLQAENVLKKQ